MRFGRVEVPKDDERPFGKSTKKAASEKTLTRPFSYFLKREVAKNVYERFLAAFLVAFFFVAFFTAAFFFGAAFFTAAFFFGAAAFFVTFLTAAFFFGAAFLVTFFFVAFFLAIVLPPRERTR